MTLPNLSRKAQEFLDKKLHESGLDYLSFLENWKNTKLPPFEDVAVRNQGAEAYLKSKQDYDAMEEIVNYANALYESLEIDTPTKLILLDDFFRKRRGSSSVSEIRDEFKNFLLHDKELDLDFLIDYNENKFTREELLKLIIENEELPKYAHPCVIERFSLWLKSKSSKNQSSAITAKRQKKDHRKNIMLNMLPISNRSNEGMTKSEWKRQAKKLHNIPDRTFDTYYSELSEHFEIGKTGKIRRKGKSPEKK